MLFSKLLFPCRCPYCNTLIQSNKPTCQKCFQYTQIAPHNQRLLNDCICVSAFRHEGVYQKAIINYKYYSKSQYHYQFAFILQDIISKRYSNREFDLYTSVPMHKKKKKGRSFDHVKLLAKETAHLNKQRYKSLLIQTKKNRTQHTLTASERVENVRDVFQCKNKNDVKDKDILLFDDIITTGSTLYEASNALLDAAARSVCCVTINW